MQFLPQALSLVVERSKQMIHPVGLRGNFSTRSEVEGRAGIPARRSTVIRSREGLL
jgi:hypothetical protein